MKTLKKTLCLVLAVVMVFGLCVMSASAHLEYADNDKITYAEAVDVMSGIGVLQGDEGGFRPTDTVRRSEAAKIIAYLLIGNSAQADALKTNSDPFTDVPASHWAAGYIAYCAQRGIINGMGDGKFNPNDQVTGLQFAKMLLTAIGYGVNDEYTGADWAINVSKDALTEGIDLFDGNLAGATNSPATREECALYAFNALTVSKVSYSALLGGYVSDRAFAGVGAVNPNEQNTIAQDFDLHDAATDADAFKRPQGHHWYQGKTTNIISADYGDPNDQYADVEDLQASYTTGVKGADIFNLLGSTFIKGLKGEISGVGRDIKVYVNGAPYSDTGATAITLANFNKDMTDVLDNTGNGVQTNVYAWSTKDDIYWDADGSEWVSARTVNHLIITVVDTYLAKVVDVKAGTATKDPVTTVEYFNLTTGSEPTAATALKYNTDEFEEGDYVLVNVTATNNKIQKMTAAVIKEGTISRYTNTKTEISVVSGGTTYIAAKNAAEYTKDNLNAADDESTVNKSIVNGKDHVLYVDEYGYLIAVGEVAAESNYVYVAKFGTKYDGTGEFDKDNLAVKVFYADGTDEVVLLNTSDGIGKTEKNLDNLNKDYADNIYKLTMKKGKAVLENAGEDKAGNVCVTKGVATVDTNLKADSKTVFFYVKNHGTYGEPDNEFALEAFIGINSVPVANKEKTSAKTYKVIKNTDNNKALAVFVDDTREGEATDTVYLYTGEYYVDEENWTVAYDVYINGQPDVLTISYKDKDEKDDAVADADDYVNRFFTVTAKNEFDDAKITANASANHLKAIDKFFYTYVPVTISSLNVEDASMFFTGTIADKDGANAKTEFAYGYSLKGVIDLTHDADDDDYIGTVRALEKAVTGHIADTYTVVIQFAENASNAIEYIYIVPAVAP